MENKMKRSSMLLTLIALCIAACLQLPVYAEEELMEEVITVGTRSSKERSASDAPVPVDVFSAEDFNALGNSADLTDNLRAMIPSYTATPATGDGSAFVRPTALRGMAPDQTLILVNGKRRHRSALVQFFAPAAGNGAHGADVGMIPGIALKSVEVLRDGAAAQYGSDAIAGVINFVTKDYSEGGEIQVQMGEHFDNEESYKVSLNGGFPLGKDGFINLSAEIFDNDALSRGIIRPDAQALLDAGVPGVGADTPFDDEPFTQSWGRPESDGQRFFVTAGVDVADNVRLYAFGNYGEVDGRYRFFYRNPAHSSIQTLRDLGFTGLIAGYTPYLDGEQEDLSLTSGVEGEFSNGTTFDFSFTLGKSKLDYFLNNTLNPSLGLDSNLQPPQRDFDVGGYEQEELTVNADFSTLLRDNLNVGYGLEWRDEEYTVNAGEPTSYFGAGSNGLGGFAPQDSGSFDRDNYAIYVDFEHDISDALLMQYAARYEDFSDFGGTTNGKIAFRYRINENFAFRGAASTGFHAPTPGQANVRTTITTFDGVTGAQVEEGLIPPTSPAAMQVGGEELKEEESFNLSAGFTASVGFNTNVTLDFYQIEVDEKIYRTRDIAVPDSTTGATISFFTNALDIESSGVDLVVTSGFEWGSSASTDLTLAYSYNKVEVTGQSSVGGVIPVSDSIVEDIENNYPNDRFVFTANTHFGDKWNLMVRTNYYGSHYDERGTINAAVDPSAKIDSTIYIDMELGFQWTEQFRVTVGGINVTDEFIDKIGPPNANRISVGLQYPRRSAANYEGGSYYVRAGYTF
jgi:iron complex outermembrane receptor protein